MSIILQYYNNHPHKKNQDMLIFRSLSAVKLGISNSHAIVLCVSLHSKIFAAIFDCQIANGTEKPYTENQRTKKLCDPFRPPWAASQST